MYFVHFVAIEGDQNDKVVVIGDGVYAIKLTSSFRKKVGPTDIISVHYKNGRLWPRSMTLAKCNK